MTTKNKQIEILEELKEVFEKYRISIEIRCYYDGGVEEIDINFKESEGANLDWVTIKNCHELDFRVLEQKIKELKNDARK